MDNLIHLRDVIGTEAAAQWADKHGISREFAVVALVGSVRARTYGVHVARVSRRGWNR